MGRALALGKFYRVERKLVCLKGDIKPLNTGQLSPRMNLLNVDWAKAALKLGSG